MLLERGCARWNGQIGRGPTGLRSLKSELQILVCAGCTGPVVAMLRPVRAHEDSPARNAVVLTVDQAVAEARESNPEIRAAVRRLTLAQRKTSTARSLDDPMLMVRDWQTPLAKPWDLNQAQLMVMLQQTFPNREKRDMRARLAGDNVEV